MVPNEIEDHNFPVNGSELEVRVVDIIQMFISTKKPTNIYKDQKFKFKKIYQGAKIQKTFSFQIHTELQEHMFHNPHLYYSSPEQG
jgi:hypothetical protein